MTIRTAEAEIASPLPRSSKLRWLLLIVGGTLLSLLLASGILAIRFLNEMHAQQQVVSHALAARTQKLSGLLLSVQSYNDAVQQFVAESKPIGSRPANSSIG